MTMYLRIILAAFSLAASIQIANPRDVQPPRFSRGAEYGDDQQSVSEIPKNSDPLTTMQSTSQSSLTDPTPIDAFPFEQTEAIDLVDPNDAIIAERARAESIMTASIPKLKDAIHQEIHALFSDTTLEKALQVLDEDMDRLLDLDSRNTDEIRNPQHLAKLAIQSLYSDSPVVFLRSLLQDIKHDKPSSPLAKKIRSHMMRGTIISWLEKKKDQFQAIRNAYGCMTRQEFIQRTSRDRGRLSTIYAASRNSLDVAMVRVVSLPGVVRFFHTLQTCQTNKRNLSR